MGLHLVPVMGTSQLSPNYFSWEKKPHFKISIPIFLGFETHCRSWTGSRHKFPGQPFCSSFQIFLWVAFWERQQYTKKQTLADRIKLHQYVQEGQIWGLEKVQWVGCLPCVELTWVSSGTIYGPLWKSGWYLSAEPGINPGTARYGCPPPPKKGRKKLKLADL